MACSSAVFFEQLPGNNVDALVGALRGKNGGDEQLQRVGVIQLTVRLGIGPIQRGDDFLQARGFGFKRFAEHFSGKINHQGTKARRKKIDWLG